ncbi:ATP-binding cassette sub-family A member 13 [Rhipicephalus microplus]|uniref:ATP-binding cassette sub-family A member 13 n=1 Tax=Rhipicephalus microplus TaxID=6941 RepID=UPI003F6B38F3
MLLAAFYWMAMFAMSKPWVTLEDYLFDDRYPKYLAAMFPVNMLYTSFFHIRWTIYFGFVADWTILSSRAFHVDNLRLGSSWRATILTCVAMLAAIWYLTHVLPSVCDHPLAPGFLFTKNYWFPHAVEVLEVGTMTPPEQMSSTYFEELPEGVTIVVRTQNLTKEYAKIKALNKVSLEALDKQITVILGTDGAGKSTLLKVLSGSIPVTSGQATVCDMDVVLSRHMIRTVASFCPRQAMFSIDMTVWEHLLLYAVLKGVPIRNIRARAREVLTETEFNDKVESYPHLLSAGAQKRLQLAISLLNKPRVLLLDEPTYSLDEEARREVWTLLEAIRSSCAIVMTSAMTEEADLIGDRVAIMSHGRVRCCGTPTFLKKAHGTGYEIRFPKTKNVLDAQDKLLEIVQQRTARARLSQTPRNVIISLGTRDTRGFADMFKRIEEFCQDHDIDDIGVTFTTLEDVFIKMSTEPDNVDLNIDTDIEMSHSQAFCDEPLQRPSFCGQMAALLLKRRAMLAVDRAAPFAVYVLFVVMTFVMEYLQSGPGWLVDLFPELVSPPRDTSFLRQSTNAGALYACDRASLDTPQVWWNPYVPYSKSIATSLMNSALLRYFSGDAGAVFRLRVRAFSRWKPVLKTSPTCPETVYLHYCSHCYTDPQRATGEPEVESGAHTVVRDTSGFVERGLRSFSPWRKVLLPPIVGLAGAAFVVAPVAETASGSKRLQLMTGVPGFVYWLSHYLFDGCLYAILWVSAAFLFVMNNKVRADTAWALFLLVLLGFPTLTGVSYLTSFFAKSVGIWYILLFCVYMAFAFQASTLSINYTVLHWLFTLLPPYAFSSGLVKLLLLDADNHLCHEYATATDGVHDLLKIACDDTRAERATLELAAIDICCQSTHTNGEI